MADEQNYGGRYLVEGLIGEGGVARVYRAKDTRLERAVAIKVLRDQFTSEPEFVERFKQEARLVASLAHPNIVGVYDVGDEAEQYYMVIEYVPGENLKQVIARESPMRLDVVISYLRQLAAALDFAHSHGVIHRDIKPENILVTAGHEIKVGDFGIARALASGALTATGTVLGSVSYLSPEQASGQPATAESDLYAAGMVLYEMLTGRVPFAGPNPIAVAMAQVNDAPPSPRLFVPAISPAVEAVVMKAIAKDPADRFHSGYEMIAALTAAKQQPAAAQVGTTAGGPTAMAAAAAPALAPTMIVPPQAMAAVPRQRPSRGGAGALAALLSTVALLIAAVLIFKGVTNGGGSTAAGSTATATHAATQVRGNPTQQPGIVPAAADSPTTRPAPTDTPAGAATAQDTPTVASVIPAAPTDTQPAVDTVTMVPTETPALPTATPVPSTDTPVAATDTPAVATSTGTASAGSPTSVTETPSAGSPTAAAGSAHGATIDLVTARGVDPKHNYSPIGASTSFKTGTSVVDAVAQVHEKAKGDSVVFKWTYPDGSSFSFLNDVVKSFHGTVTAYAELIPRGPGTYSVSTSINGQVLASVSFAVGEGGGTPASQPTAASQLSSGTMDTPVASGTSATPADTSGSAAGTATAVTAGTGSVPAASDTPAANTPASSDTPVATGAAPVSAGSVAAATGGIVPTSTPAT